MNIKFKLTSDQKSQLNTHLFPGDNLEAVAIGLCGKAKRGKQTTLFLHKIVCVPHEVCIRSEKNVDWPIAAIQGALDEAESGGYEVVKFHSHCKDSLVFSTDDDKSDKNMYQLLSNWLDSIPTYLSFILLEDGRLNGRQIIEEQFYDLEKLTEVGDIITEHLQLGTSDKYTESSLRNRQTFGEATFNLLSKLKIGVIGCSGTGGPTIEQLSRLNVGELVLVDPDYIDHNNLNRIPYSTHEDAVKQTPKVKLFERVIKEIGVGTKVTAINSCLFKNDVIKELSDCDFIFGCVDSIDARHLLNKLSSFYLIPYIDMGVKLVADGLGGISSIDTQYYYIIPGGTSLYSLGVYNLKQLEASTIFRTNRAEYDRRKEEGYISGINVDKPAVAPVNTAIASISIMDFLSRIHNYRGSDNSNIAGMVYSASKAFMAWHEKGTPCESMRLHVGKGDKPILLEHSEFGNIEEVACDEVA